MNQTRLIRIQDLRPVDFISGKRLAIPTEEMATCHRCARRHAIVWVVEQAGQQYRIGSGCGSNAIAAGELDLSRAELAAARAEARKLDEAERTASLLEWTGRWAALAREALQAEVEPPIKEEVGTGGRNTLTMGDARQVYFAASSNADFGANYVQKQRFQAIEQLRRNWRRNRIAEVQPGPVPHGYGSVSSYLVDIEQLLRG